MDTAFAYHDVVQSKTIYHQTNLCLHNGVAQTQDYFFLGNSLFFEEWAFFIRENKLRNFPNKQYELSIIPVTLVYSSDIDAYNFNYDLDIFDYYDQMPVKVYQKQVNDYCDVYVGDFFMSRYLFHLHVNLLGLI